MTPDTPPSAIPSPRPSIAGPFVVAVFALLSVYYGSSYNVSVFLFAWLLFLVPWLTVVPQSIRQIWQTSRVVTTVALSSLALIVASYLGSISKESSFSAALGLAICPLAFLFCACMAAEPREQLLRWLRGIVVIFAAVSAWQLVGSGTRAYQPLSEPNAYAALLYLTALPWMHRWLGNPAAIAGWRDWSQLVAFALLALAAFATISRVGTFVFFAAMLFWLGSAGLSSRRGIVVAWRRHIAAALVLVATFIGSIALLDGGLATELADGPVDDSIGVRGFLVSSGLQAVDGSLVGTGVYTFPLLYPSVRTDADISSAGLYIHNDYLQFLLEGGPLLALLLLLFLAWIIVRFVTASARFWQTGRWEVESGVLMALGCALAHAVVNFIFYVPILALLIGLLAGGLVRTPAMPQELTGRTRSSTAVGIVCAIFGLGLSFYLLLETLNAGILGGQRYVPFTAECAQSDECRLRFADQSARLNSDWGAAHLARAVLLEQQLFESSSNRRASNELVLDQALAGYRRSLSVDAWNPRTYLLFREFVSRHPGLQSRLAETENPVALLQRALELNPYDVVAVGAVVAGLESIGRREAAQRFLLGHLDGRIANFGQRYPEDAEYFLTWLETTAAGKPDILAKVDELKSQIVVSPFEFSQRWWFR
ncbi:MAG: O-antigen ligase family protein [Pseudomonadaceae bacterium]|nr:O-antigen ligase family protein [Pseudomonadaceae bacterium]